MALLQSEDFAVWYLRTSYLISAKDGIADRVVNINSSILNTPGFRGAGWSSEPVRRAHSPPIPTAVTSEYFQDIERSQTQESEDVEDSGMVTGRTSTDTIGPASGAKRRRRKEQIEDDDSSDLSDESEEDADENQRAAQQIRFAKMASRTRADSSPMRKGRDSPGPNVRIIPPSTSGNEGRKRTSSLGTVEAVKARARRDTTTSSDMSSENEVDPGYFQRRHIRKKPQSKSNPLSDAYKGQALQGNDIGEQRAMDQEDSDGDSTASDLSSDLGETVDSVSILNNAAENDLHSSSLTSGISSTNSGGMFSESPKRTRTMQKLPDLPPARPISQITPVSSLSQALNAQKKKPKNPVQAFASLSGKGSANPLWIKIYAPFSSDPEEPFEMPIEKMTKDGNNVIVAEAIGLALWRYIEENSTPTLKPEQLDVNKWTLRMVEDGEVEYDFPALSRTGPLSDFTSNNNRAARARSRQRPFDEFALVEAQSHEYEANKKETPQFVPKVEEEESSPPTRQGTPRIGHAPPLNRAPGSRSNVLANQPFSSALSGSTTPADQPAPMATQSTPRLDRTKTLRIRYFDIDVPGRTMTVEITIDSYIAEILDHVCNKWNLDKANFLLKVAGTNTVAPLDRTVEALGTRNDLDLVRRRFGAGPAALMGSPGGSSPNAPLLLDVQGAHKTKKGQPMLHPLAQKQDMMSSASNFKKYYVTRKQLASFTQGHQRVLVFDGDFLHIMSSDSGKSVLESGSKSTSVAFADVLRCKVSTRHSKVIRITVRKGSESKRYDFETRSTGEAQEIVDDISREMRLAR